MRTPVRFQAALTAALVLAGTLTCAAAEVIYPRSTGYVNDFAGVMAPQERSQLEALLAAVERKTTAEVAVVTVDTVKPLTIEDYSVGLIEEWGLGKEDKDNGVLILLAINDREGRIEPGYGLEGALPDALCIRIAREQMLPLFKQGRYSQGLVNGALSVVTYVAREYNVDPASFAGSPLSSPASRAVPARGRRALSLFLSIGMMFVIYRFFGPMGFLFLMPGGFWRGGGGSFGGGGMGGGFGGFGGGMSGGGGASFHW